MKDQIVSKQNPLSHYKWGGNCDGWNLMSKANVSIKQELMPTMTSEKLHFHHYAEQFFFILKGQATFFIENENLVVDENCGLYINAGQKHKIINKGIDELEFILFSFPSTQNDRIDCE
jgi:mannose-6-phosphate isomerase-like protein (cupin superfamily)